MANLDISKLNSGRVEEVSVTFRDGATFVVPDFGDERMRSLEEFEAREVTSLVDFCNEKLAAMTDKKPEDFAKYPVSDKLAACAHISAEMMRAAKAVEAKNENRHARRQR